MLKTNMEIMKEIKFLNDKKENLIQYEKDNCYVIVTENEDEIKSDYNYEDLRKQIDNIDKEIRKLKTLLAYSNSTTIVPEYGITIGESLIYLSQLQNKYSTIKPYESKKKIERISSSYSSKIEYKKFLLDKNKIQNECDLLLHEINKLQMCIDRINLTNYIEL